MTQKTDHVLNEVKSLQTRLLKIQYLQHLIATLKTPPKEGTLFEEVHLEVYEMCVDFFETKILELAGNVTPPKANINTTPQTFSQEEPTPRETPPSPAFLDRTRRFGGKTVRGMCEQGILIEGVAIRVKEPNIVVENQDGLYLIHESQILEREKY